MEEPDPRLNEIERIVAKNLKPSRIWLFGSRAEGTHRKNSDYDIAYEGSNAEFRDVRKTKDQISKVLGIYSFDLVDLEKMNDGFKHLIREKGKIIHERN